MNRANQVKKKLKTFKKKLKQYPRRKLILILAGIFFILFLVFLIWLFKDVPNPTSLTKSPAPVSTKILDRNGKLLYEVYTEQKRDPVAIDTLPEYVKQATISIEDKNFYRHLGLDFGGILRAAFNTLTGRRLEGGSTITV